MGIIGVLRPVFGIDDLAKKQMRKEPSIGSWLIVLYTENEVLGHVVRADSHRHWRRKISKHQQQNELARGRKIVLIPQQDFIADFPVVDFLAGLDLYLDVRGNVDVKGAVILHIHELGNVAVH